MGSAHSTHDSSSETSKRAKKRISRADRLSAAFSKKLAAGSSQDSERTDQQSDHARDRQSAVAPAAAASSTRPEQVSIDRVGWSPCGCVIQPPIFRKPSDSLSLIQPAAPVTTPPAPATMPVTVPCQVSQRFLLISFTPLTSFSTVQARR